MFRPLVAAAEIFFWCREGDRTANFDELRVASDPVGGAITIDVNNNYNKGRVKSKIHVD
jgi:hypothetical protein